MNHFFDLNLRSLESDGKEEEVGEVRDKGLRVEELFSRFAKIG